MEFVKIPAGKYKTKTFGREVEFEFTKDFYLGKTEVTQKQYREVMELVKKEEEAKTGKSEINANPSDFKPTECNFLVFCVERDLPVEQVSWNDAQKFIRKLNDIVGDGRDRPLQYRLPTEVEWEYAYRAGSHTDFYWGNTFDGNFAWHAGNSIKPDGKKGTHPVGLKKPNAFGLYDMAGNLWEWCEDYYELPEIQLRKNPQELERIVDPKPLETSKKGLRGGSWSSSGTNNFRADNRNDDDPGDALSNRGFRLFAAPNDTPPE